MTVFSLKDLETIINERAGVKDGSSWTGTLVSSGLEKATKKLGEEAFETVIAALKESDEAVMSESADLLYHLMVVLHMRGIMIDDVFNVLQSRTSQSGILEKTMRPQK